MLLSADSVLASPHLIPNLTYDSFKDLQPISLRARIPLVMLVNNSVPVTTVKEFVRYAKANNGKLSYASPGIGTTSTTRCSRTSPASSCRTSPTRAAARRSPT